MSGLASRHGLSGVLGLGVLNLVLISGDLGRYFLGFFRALDGRFMCLRRRLLGLDGFLALDSTHATNGLCYWLGVTVFGLGLSGV